jgi:hypothetical protein
MNINNETNETKEIEQIEQIEEIEQIKEIEEIEEIEQIEQIFKKDNNNLLNIDKEEPKNILIKELIDIQKTIESMSKYNQIEILRILKIDNKITLNENKYGIFINLSEVDILTINKLKNFIQYVNTQEMNLIQIENQKEIYKNQFFINDNKLK